MSGDGMNGRMADQYRPTPGDRSFVCDECGANTVSCGYRWWDGVLGELVLSGVCGVCADMIRADDPEIEFEPVAVTASL